MTFRLCVRMGKGNPKGKMSEGRWKKEDHGRETGGHGIVARQKAPGPAWSKEAVEPPTIEGKKELKEPEKTGATVSA